MSTLPVRALAWLLHHANAHAAGSSRRTEVYALKDAILRKYGSLVDHDLQHLVDSCWGDESQRVPCGPRCWRCGGTGIHQERWVVLERWTMGGHVFHRPTPLLRPPNALPRLIEGRIRHLEVSHRTAEEARLWLALLFDRTLFVSMLRGSRHCGWQWRPMLALQSLVFLVSTRLTRRRCPCGQRFMTWGTGWLICKDCRQPNPFAAAASGGDDDDLPF